MKCVYRKLKESITDTSFPVLPIIEEKSYFYQTEASQSVDISALLPQTLRFSEIKVEAICKAATLDAGYNNEPAVYLRGGTILVGFSGTDYRVILDSKSVSAAATLNRDYDMVADGYNNVITIDGVTTSGTTVSTSTIREGRLLGGTSLDFLVKVKEVKLTDMINDVLIADLVPAVLNGEGIVYDKVSGVALRPSSGTLGID